MLASLALTLTVCDCVSGAPQAATNTLSATGARIRENFMSCPLVLIVLENLIDCT